MTVPAFDHRGRQLAAGEAPALRYAVADGHATHRTEARTGAPKRPCARCGNLFFPTLKRRMLCNSCYRGVHSQVP